MPALLLALLLLAPPPVWTQSELGGGGYIVGVSPVPGHPDRVYAWTDVGGLHRSDDAGRSWTPLHATLPPVEFPTRANLYVRGVSPDPRDPDVVLAATGYRFLPRTGVFRSDDAGRTWRNVLPVLFASEIGKAAGVVLVRDGRDPDRLLAGASLDGLFESRDAGLTWAKIGGDGFDGRVIGDVDLAPDGRIWVTAVALDDWVADEYKPLVTLGDDGKARAPGGFWRSDDGGETFVELDAPGLDEVVQDPLDPDTLYGLAGVSRVVRSTDAGETWHDFAAGLAAGPEEADDWNPQPWKYRALAAGPDFLVIASMKGEVYRLDAGGEGPWQPVEREAVVVPDDWWGGTFDAPGLSGWPHSLKAAATVVIDPNDADRWWLTDWFSLWRSPDAGRTWHWSARGIEDTYVQAVEGDPSDGSIVHAGLADVGYFRSADAGASFRGLSRDTLIANNVWSIAVPEADPRRVYATSNAPHGGGWYANALFVSDDRGLTWREATLGGDFPAKTAKSYHGFAQVPPGEHNLKTVVADDDPDRVWLAVAGEVGPREGGVYFSDDAGETLAFAGAGLPAGEPFFRETGWQVGDVLAVATGEAQVALSNQEGRPARLFRRDSGDAPYEEVAVEVEGEMMEVKADPFEAGRFWLAVRGDRGGLFRSDDGGATWDKIDQPAETPGAAQIVLDRRVPDRLAVSTANGVIYSQDAGRTWARLAGGGTLTDRSYWNMGCFAGPAEAPRLVVGTGGSGLFHLDLPR